MYELRGELENIPPRAFPIKEEDYVMIWMFAYGTNENMGKDKFHTIGR